MYESVSIKNFRCFKDFTIDSLERVNLIAGQNSVGKTSLLEALFLHLGPNNPELSMTVSGIRGIGQYQANAESFWGWLFHGKQMDETIEISDQRQNTLRMHLEDSERIDQDASTSTVETASTTRGGSRALVLEHCDGSAKKSESRAYIEIEDGTAKLKTKGLVLPDVQGTYLSSRARSLKEDSERFSQVVKVGRGHKHRLVRVLKHVEPRLTDLSIQMFGANPVLHGDIGLAELIPVPFMGEGVARLLTILLAIGGAPGGTVLVDEIENGLHTSVMEDVWRGIAEAARLNQTQVFATTHSRECISAAHEVFVESDTYDFSLHRLERVNGDIEDVVYDQEALDAALTAEMGIR